MGPIALHRACAANPETAIKNKTGNETRAKILTGKNK
jgi:hypothetical protein